MEKVVRIYNSCKEQENARIEDMQKMTPNQRVQMLLQMQYQYFNWSKDTKIERVFKIRKLGV